MAAIYVDKSKFKIFRKVPRNAASRRQTGYALLFNFTTNNVGLKTGIVAKRRNQIRYG